MMWPIGVPFSMTLSDHHLRRHLLVAKPTYRMQRLSYSCAAIIPIITRFQLTRVTRSVCGCELANLVKFSLRVDLFPRVVQQGKQVCWTSLLSDQKLRGPHVAQQQQLSIDICGPRATWAANPLTAAACCRWTGQTDGHTDGRTDTPPFYDAYCILCGPRNKSLLRTCICQSFWFSTDGHGSHCLMPPLVGILMR